MAAQHQDTDHKHGDMDIAYHQKTFNGFIRMATWVCVIAAAVLIFLALANA